MEFVPRPVLSGLDGAPRAGQDPPGHTQECGSVFEHDFHPAQHRRKGACLGREGDGQCVLHPHPLLLLNVQRERSACPFDHVQAAPQVGIPHLST